MPSFCAVNYSNCANRAKVVKIIAKKAWNFQKWEGKGGQLKFSGKINFERKLERTRTRINNAFCFPFIGFPTQSSQYQILKLNTYSILGSRSFMIPLILNTNFAKRESKIGYP